MSDKKPMVDPSVQLQALYDDLKALAQRVLEEYGTESGPPVSPDSLVWEALAHLDQAQGVAWRERAHVLRLAARVVRQGLVDRARAWTTPLLVTAPALAAGPVGVDVLALHEGIDRLAQAHRAAAEVAEMRLFGGATSAETAEALSVPASKRSASGCWPGCGFSGGWGSRGEASWAKWPASRFHSHVSEPT